MVANQIMGVSIPFNLRNGNFLLISFISMGEWQIFGDIIKINEKLAMREFLYFSLNRANPLITRRKVRFLMFRYRKSLTSMINAICKMSVPEVKDDKQHVENAKEAERNVKTLYRQLSMMYTWTPVQISNLSPIQIQAYLTGGKDGTGIVKMSNVEYQAFRRGRSMN